MMVEDFYRNDFPKLDLGNGYILREQLLKDTEDFFNYYSEPEVSRYILATKPKDLEDASSEINYCRNLFYYKRGGYWSIARIDNDEMIGAIGLYINNNHQRAEISYDLSKKYWRQGIMTLAIKRLLEYSFLHIGIRRMEAQILKENEASISLLEKLGFVYEGSLKNYRFYQNKSHDVEMYAITPEMYFAQLGKENNSEIFKSEVLEKVAIQTIG